MNENIVIITPTYNEVDNIEIFIKQIFEVLPNSKLIIVDDNSSDGTIDKIKQLQSSYPNIKLIVRHKDRGRGYAGITAFKEALELYCDIIVEMDADLSHSPYEIPKLIEPLKKENIDVVVGSRYIKGGKDNERNIIRRLISFFARKYLKILTSINLKDPTSGFKAYKRKVIEKILPYLTSKDQFIVTEVNYLCKIFNFKFYEVPITFHKRYLGKSKLKISGLIKYLFKVIFLITKFFIQDKYNLLFLKVLFLSNLFRLIIINLFGLTDDESHYWQYSQYLDFSYFDHPPMVGYLIYVSTKIFGNNLYGVRIPSILCFTLGSFYFYRLIREIYDEKVAFYSFILFSTIPIFFTGSIITTPDSVLAMFWLIYIFYFYKFTLIKNHWTLYLCGIFLGLALLSKYTGIFLLVSTLIIILNIKELRRILFKKDFIIFLLIVLTFFSPTLLWNTAHNFISFKYQLSHGMGQSTKISLLIFLKNFLFQSLYISPLIFFIIWYYLLHLMKDIKKLTFKEKNLLYFSLPGIVFFNIIGFKNQILPHWPAIFYITLIPFLISKSENFKNFLFYTFSSLLLTIFLILYSVFAIFPIPEKFKDADTPDKLYGWDVAAKNLYNLLNIYKTNFIITNKYYSAGQLRFELSKYFKKNIPSIFCLDNEFNQYDFWYKDISSFDKKNAILFIENRFDKEKILEKYPFKNYKLILIINFRKNKKWPQRQFKFYLLNEFNYEKAVSFNFIEKKYNNFLSVKEFFRNYDKYLFLKINKNKLFENKTLKITFYIITNLGNGLLLVPLVIIVLFFIDKKNLTQNIVMFLFIIILGGLIIQILKFLFDKPRPLKIFSDILNQPINVIGEQLREFGFPSGHTFLAFSTATFLSYLIKNKILKIILFFLALLVGISRIIVGAHFISDVIAGFIIGVIFTTIVIKIKKEINT